MPQERITITIDKELLKRVDLTINKTSVRNRSHAIEQLLLKTIGVSVINTAVIFLGGDKLDDNYKNALTALNELINRGVKNLHIVYGEFGLQYLNHFTQLPDINIMLHQTELGSGGGLYEIIDGLTDEFFIIECGKKSKFNWDKMINYFTLYCPTLCGETDITSFGSFVSSKRIKQYLTDEFSIFSKDIVQKINNDNQIIIIQ